MAQLYSSTIKSHYRNPLNTGKLSVYSHYAEEINPLCGDETKIYLQITNGVIEDSAHETRGCMICVASASAVSEIARGKKLEEIKKLGVPDLAKLLSVAISPARESCATLILKAISSHRFQRGPALGGGLSL